MGPTRLACWTGIVLWLAALGSSPARAADADAGTHPFSPIARVLASPRCMNCHTNTAWPRQTDGAQRHTQNVLRGPLDSGLPAMRCASCHAQANQGRVPGAPNWHLAPRTMGWEGLSTAQLCSAIKNPRKNGGREAQAVIEHMQHDPLVLWAWQPGADRTTPPLSQPEFAAALTRWAEQGQPCPAP